MNFLSKDGFDIEWSPSDRKFLYIRTQTAIGVVGVNAQDQITRQDMFLDALTLTVADGAGEAARALGFSVGINVIFLALINNVAVKSGNYDNIDADPLMYFTLPITDNTVWRPASLLLRSSLVVRNTRNGEPTNVLGTLHSRVLSGREDAWTLDVPSSNDLGKRQLFGPVDMPTTIEFWITALSGSVQPLQPLGADQRLTFLGRQVDINLEFQYTSTV